MARDITSFVRDSAPLSVPAGTSESDGWRLLQNTLATMGFDPGPIDGIPGPRTLNATLSAMQRGAAVVKETAPMALIGLGLAVGLGGGVLLARRKRAAA